MNRADVEKVRRSRKYLLARQDVQDPEWWTHYNYILSVAERLLPKRPDKFVDLGQTIYTCPTCNRRVKSIYNVTHLHSIKLPSSCNYCGQQLDWSNFRR